MFGYLEDRFGVGLRMFGIRDRSVEQGINREPWSIWRFDLLNSGVDSLFSVPGGEVEILSSGPSGTHQRRYVFGKWTCLAASKNRICVAPTDEFLVFRSDGAWLGYAEIPEGLLWFQGEADEQVLEIGSDYLLGVWADDLGVEQVRRYRIKKR